MKKILLIAFLIGTLCKVGLAQVASTYTWSQTSTTYSAISGGTAHITDATDDANATGTIGFPFIFNGTVYNTVNVSTNGHLSFGTAIATNNYTPISAGTSNGVISAMSRDLIGGTSGTMRSQTIGTAPNRIFVAQWSTWRRYVGSAQGDNLNFQIRLHETSQLIEIVYGTCTSTSTAGAVFVGLRGSATTDFNIRTGAWASTTLGGANTATVNVVNTAVPASGLTFRYTPTQPVIAAPTASNSGPVCAGATANLTAAGLAPYGQVANLSGTQTISSGISGQTAINNNFTIEFWANPTATRTSTTQSNSGTVGTSAQRYAIYPDQRGTAAGVGISVGTNGVSVFEHGDSYLPSTLVYDIPLSGWTHIAVVYNARTPTLYINGGFAKTGTISARATVYPSSGTSESYGYYAGQLDNMRIFSGARTQADIRSSMFLNTPIGSSGGTLSHQYNYDASNTNANVGSNNTNNGATFSTANFFTYTWAGGASLPAASTATTQTTTAGLTSSQNYTVTPSVSGNLIPGTASAATTVTVNDLPQGSLSSNTPICSGDQAKLVFTATAGTGPYTVVYNDGTANRTQTGVVSGTQFNPFTNPLINNSYTLVSVAAANSCTRSSGFTDGSEALVVNSCGAPTISGFTPASGCYNSATVITLTGTNLASVNTVTVNGVAATFSVLSATSLSITLPATATGTGTIYVSSLSGNATSAATFTVNPLATPGTFQYANASTQTICTGATISCSNVTAPTNGGSGTLSVVWYCGEEISPGVYGNWRESTLGNVSGTTSSSNLNAAAGGGTGMATALSGYNPRLDFPSATKFYIIRRGYNSNCGPCVGGCQDQMFYLNLLALPSGGSVPTTSFCSVTGAGTVSVTGVSNATQYSWALPGALSGASTTSSINVTGTAVGSYTVTVTPQNTSGALVCPASPITGTVNITASPGNPAVFGSNTWNVYAYLGANRDNLGAVSYAGYYTQNLSPQQGFNTQALWANTANPSVAAGYNGCPLPDDNFTFVHKRQGFTPGYYSISVDNWDDGSILYINGSSTASFQASAWSGDAATNGFAAPYVLSSCTYLDASSTIEFRTAEGAGGANAQLTLTALSGISASAVATNQTTCNNGTGSIALTRSGGSGSYTYSWTGPNGFTSATQSPASLGSGTYNVTVTDAGCPALTGTATATITAPWSASAGPDIGVCVGNTGTLTGSITGTLPPSTGTIFSENFDGNNGAVTAAQVTTSATANHKWQLRSTTASSTQWWISSAANGYSCAIGGNSLLFRDGAGVKCDYTWDEPMTQIAYCNAPINASGYNTLNLKFDFKAGGESVSNVVYDYLTIVYSTNGTTWTNLNIGNCNTCAYNSNTAGLTNTVTDGYRNTTGTGTIVALPAALNGTSFYIGFRWNNDNGTGTAPGLVIDNISITGTSTAVPTYTWSGPGTISPTNTTQSPTVTTAGTYTLSVAMGGCTSTDQAVVSVTSTLTAPTVTANSGCKNTSITVSAAGAGAGESYKWYTASTGGTLLQTGGATYTGTSLLTSTTYYVAKYNTTTNCESSRTAVTATVNACYVAEFISMNTGSTNWCAGETRNVTVTIKNVGTQAWTNSNPDINIGAKWNADADHTRIDANGLAPGATQTYTFSMTAPTTPGSNNLGFDVAREGDCWFRNNDGGCGPGNTLVSTPSVGGTGYLSAAQNILAIPTGGTIATVNYCSTTGAGSATVTGVSNATQYTWSLPSGLSGTSTSATINLTGNTPGSYTISVTPQNVSGVTCPAAAPVTGIVNVIATPSAPATVSASGAACNSFNLSWAAAANASGYEIQVSTDAGFSTSVGSYNGSTDAGNITSTTVTGLAINTTYYVRVRARNGAVPCRSGFTNLSTTSITTTTVPVQPGGITGNTTVCPSTSQTYSVGAVAGATSYTWTLPSGWSGASTTNSITVTTTTTSGNVTVLANNACGAGTASTLGVTVTPVPAQPGTITGATTSVCQNSTQTYSIAAVSGATSYTWTLPSGWSGSSTTNSITATAGPGALTGNVSVTASNSCGTGPARTLAVTDIKPAPTANAGNDIVIPCTVASVTLNGSSNNTTLLNEDFGTTNYEISNATSAWRIYYRTGTSPANRTQWHITNNTSTFPCLGTGSGLTMYDPIRPNNCDYAYDDGAMDEVAYNTNNIDARYYTGVNLTFDYKVSGEYETGINTVWDYMQVVYSTNGGTTWNTVNAGNNGGSYTFNNNNGVNNGFFSLTAGGVFAGSANINLSSLVAGNQFLIGFRWVNDAATGYIPGFWVDNIKVTGSATYSWGSSPAGGIVSGGTTSNPVVNQPGTYTVTVTGGNGCTATDNMVLTQNSLPAVPTVSNNSPKCIGGTVQLTAAGLAPGGQVANLTGTQTIGGASLSSANNFTMELWVNPIATRPTTAEQNGVNDISGVTNQRYAIMPLNYNTDAGVGISVGTNGVSVFEHGAGYLPSLLVYDVPLTGWNHIAVVYTNKTPSLYINGIFIKSGLTSQKPNVFPSLGTSSSYGYYEGALDNIRVWSTSRTMTEITSNMYLETPTSSTGLTAHYSMNGNTNASTGANLTNGGATFSVPSYFTYTWSGPNAPAGSTAETQSTSAINSAGSNNYTVRASLGNCAGTPSAPTSVVINSLPTAGITGTTAICAGGSRTLTATGGGTYVWSNGPTTATNTVSAAGTYTVTVTNNGCTATASATTTVTALPTAGITGNTAICAGGSRTLTATGGGTYVWSNGPTTATNTVSAAGTYTVTVTNNGCTATASATTTVTALPTAGITGNTAICAGGNTTLTATGGGTYVWSNGPTTATNTVSAAGAYTVTVTNNGCTATASATTTVTPLPTAGITGTTAICSGSNTTLTATGGGTYVWSNGPTTATNTVSAAGTYTVTVTNNGCTATASATTTVTPLPTAGITGTTAICSGSNTTLTVTGGGTYIWSNGPTTATNTVSAAGTYTVTVTNNGCTATASATTTVTALPTAGITGTTAICAGGSRTLTATGGGTYVWSNGPTTATNAVSAAGTYTVTVTNNGCTATASAITTVIPLPTAGITGNTAICAGGNTTLTATGGGTYVWNNGPTTATNTVSAAGTYTVTVTNNGCTATASATTTVTALPTATITGTDTICPGNSSVFTASGGTSYAWSHGPTTAAVTVSSAGTYTVTVTSNGCTATASRTLSLGGTSTISLVSNTANICSGGFTSIALTASEPGSTYNWTRANTSAVTGDASGNSVSSPISVQLSSSNSQITQFSIQAQSPAGCYSNIITVNVTVEPGATVSFTELNNKSAICANDTLQFIAQVSGGSGTPVYQWQRFLSGVWINVGNNSPTYNTGPVLNTGSADITAIYRLQYTTNGTGCGMATSAPTNVTIHANPTAEPEFDDCVARIIGAKYSYIILANGGSATPFHVNDSTNLGAVKMYADADTSYVIYRLPQNGTTAPYVFTTTDANGCSVTSTFNREITYPQNIVTATTSGNRVNDCQLRGWDEWEHFQNPADKDEVILSVNSKGIDLGRVTVTSYVDAPGVSVMNSNANTCTGTPQAAMRRHFKITSSAFGPGDPFTNGANVGVRLYFSDADFAELSNRAAANDDATECSKDDNITDINQLFVTKYSDNSFSGTENGTYADNDPALGIYRVFGPARPASSSDYVGPVSDMRDNGFDTEFQPNQATGHNYVELDVTEFSEFWLHGSQSGSPLPVEMLFIEAKGIENTFIRVDWATSTEIDNWKFEVERSEDGATFTKVGEVIGHATSTERNDYMFNDLGVKQGVRYYYRLKQIDFDGKFEYSPIVSAKLDVDDAFSVGEFIPNPTTGRSTLTFKTKANKDVKAQVVNYLGQVVMEQSKTIRNADNTMYFDFDKLAAGTYMVTLSTADKNYTKRVVLTR